MASWFTNRGKLLIVQGSWETGSGDVYAMGLIDAAALPAAIDSEAEIQDLNFVSELLALTGVDEPTVPSYSRETITRVSAAEDDTNNRVDGDASNVVFAGLEVGADICAGFITRVVTNDADSDLLLVFTLSSVIPTNGSDVTITIDDVWRAS